MLDCEARIGLGLGIWPALVQFPGPPVDSSSVVSPACHMAKYQQASMPRVRAGGRCAGGVHGNTCPVDVQLLGSGGHHD